MSLQSKTFYGKGEAPAYLDAQSHPTDPSLVKLTIDQFDTDIFGNRWDSVSIVVNRRELAAWLAETDPANGKVPPVSVREGEGC